jgi:cytochrome b561
MGMPNSRYDLVAMALHWLTALFVLGLIVTGLTMETNVQRATPLDYRLFQLHKSLGITVLLFTLLRLGWRLTHRPPPTPADQRPWETGVAHATHWLFYLLLLGLPLLGWAAVSASPLNIPTVLYGVLPWPAMPILGTLADKRPVAHLLGDLHANGAWIMIVLLALHIGAALWHQLVRHDAVVARMVPAARLSERRP